MLIFTELVKFCTNSTFWGKFWSKSRFTSNNKPNMLLNNMSEAFDSVIVEARAKHIYTMLKDIRLYLLNR